jgi:hypothetical protein
VGHRYSKFTTEERAIAGIAVIAVIAEIGEAGSPQIPQMKTDERRIVKPIFLIRGHPR